MQIGIYDADGHNFPNLPLMKISAWHKARGDDVEMVFPLKHYDRVYVSRVFGEEYTDRSNDPFISADEIYYGGTGYAIKVENGKEVYRKELDPELPYEIEHIYPDYSLYPELTKDTAYGFLTRGCPNNCGFCIITQKEGRISHKVADLSEWWRGQKNIVLLDANITACRDRMELLNQLAASGANVDFMQGVDARFITDEVAEALVKVKTKLIHFAFDQMKNATQIIKGLETYKRWSNFGRDKVVVYVLTNYDTTFEEDMFRVEKIIELGYTPDVRIYRKNTAPRITRDLQRWCNSKRIMRTCSFWDYAPRKDGMTMGELYALKN